MWRNRLWVDSSPRRRWLKRGCFWPRTRPRQLPASLSPLTAAAPPEGRLWRERMGVEPTIDTARHRSSDLKSAEPTGAQPLPRNTSILDRGYRAVKAVDLLQQRGYAPCQGLTYGQAKSGEG